MKEDAEFRIECARVCISDEVIALEKKIEESNVMCECFKDKFLEHTSEIALAVKMYLSGGGK